MPSRFLLPLTPDDLAAAGVPEQWRYGMADRVRFSELDALNHANHTACLRWFESLRLHYCRDYGVSNYDTESPELVLKAIDAQYHKPMYCNEPYIAAARTLSFRSSSFRMHYAVFAGDLRVEGTALIVLLQRDGSGKFPLTAAMKRAFAERDGASGDP